MTVYPALFDLALLSLTVDYVIHRREWLKSQPEYSDCEKSASSVSLEAYPTNCTQASLPV